MPDDNSTQSSSAFSCTAVVENAKPTSFRELPPLAPQHDTPEFCSILLFYQYVEPLWGPTQHKRALKKLMELCQENSVTGRGRVAPEGLNCTLSGPGRGIRQVCLGLRAWNPIFNETDFKITDGVPVSKQFKSLSVRKTEELVAYGLKGDAVAPSLTEFAGTHLEADEYHDALQDPNAVVVDVRNFYETALGNFQPPPGGAKLIDPKLRNSIEFPKWLAAPETQKELDGKKVLMYCTGGIRCERATALLNEMVAASESNNDKTKDSDKDSKDKTEAKASSEPAITCKPKGVFELRGGIERYVKTYPKGGFWKGKNYLFDRRMEQIPEERDMAEVESEIDSKCCVCLQKWTVYRGQFSCASKLCGVPVIVCNACTQYATQHQEELQCDLCQENYRLSVAQPNLAEIKRKAHERATKSQSRKKAKRDNDPTDREYYPDRLFVSRLPLTATVTKLKQLLLPASGATTRRKQDQEFRVHWLQDPQTNAFYGSCMVQMPSASMAKEAIEKANTSTRNDNNSDAEQKRGLRMDKKRIKVSRVWKKESKDGRAVPDVFAQSTFQAQEYPPIQ